MDHEEIFEKLEPPPHGLAKLRDRLEASPSSPNIFRRRFAVPSLAFALVAAAAVVFFFLRRSASDPLAEARLQSNGAEMSLGLAPTPKVPVSVEADSRSTTAVAQVETANPNVAFYWVSSTEWHD